MQASTKVLLGLGVAAALGLGFVLLGGSTPSGGSGGGSGGGAGSGAKLPANIPLLVGQHAKFVLPDMPSAGQSWVMTTSAPSVVSVADVGYAGGAPPSGVGLHAFTLTGVSAGSAVVTATLMNSANGQAVSGVAPLTATVTVVATIGGANPHNAPPGGGGGGVVVKNAGGVNVQGGVNNLQSQQPQQGGKSVTGGATVHGKGGSVYQPKTVVVAWPAQMFLLGTDPTKQSAQTVNINVGDVLTVVFKDGTAPPVCVPVSSPKQGFNVTCNTWTVGWIDSTGAVWTALGSTFPVVPTPGQQSPPQQLAAFAALSVSGLKPGYGTLVFTRTDANGNVQLTWSVPIVVSTP